LNKNHLDEFMSFVMINKRYPLIKDEIIDLVHKSMPVKSDYGKPIDQDDTLFLNRVCPVCNNIILMEYPFDYCPFCGQRLEGEEYDE
jgi:rubrerythrin